MRALLLAAAMFGACVAAASAEPGNLTRATAGYLYFNRPGATAAEHDSELVNCSAVARNNYLALAHPPRAGDPASHGLVGDLVTGMMLSGWERAHFNIVVEHCMVVRGWRLVRLDSATGERLEHLDQAALARELAPMIGAAQPPGDIVRTFRNEGADPRSIIVSSPANAQRVLLSALAADPNAPSPLVAVTPALPQTLTFAPLINPIPLSDTLQPPPGSAVLIVGVVGPRAGSRRFVVDLRSQHDSTVQTLQLLYRDPQRDGDRVSNSFAFIVPAGEWSLGEFPINLSFCLGAPSFVANPGDIIFVGEFDSGAVLNANTSSEALARHVPEALRSTARTAQWTNGATWPCPPYNLYALEFPETPFRPDYHWGSRAQ